MPTMFDNLRKRFTKSLRVGVTANTADIATSAWSVDVMTGLSSEYMSLARPFTQVSVVQAAIQAMRRNATKAIMQVGYWDEDGGFIPVDHPLQSLWQRPSPGESDATLIEHIYTSLCDGGNAYIQAISNTAGSAITELMPIPSAWIQRPVMGESINEVLEWPVQGTDWGRNYTYGVPSELMLAYRHGRSSYAQSRGVSVLDSVVAEMALVKIIGQYETTVLSRSGVPSLIVSLKTIGNMSDATLAQVQADLSRAVSGKAVGRPFVGTSEMDIKSPGFSPRDLSVSEMADLATARICGVLGWAPMSLKQPDTGKTYSNLVEANKASWRDAVIPFLDLVAGELTRLVQTMPIASCGVTSQPNEELCVRFDTSQIEELSVDRKALMDIATAGVGAGIFTVNEARATLGLGEMEEVPAAEAVEPEEPAETETPEAGADAETDAAMEVE